RRQPSDLEVAPDDDQEVGAIELEHEAWLGFDEMRILIAARQRLDFDPIPADLARDGRQVLSTGYRIDRGRGLPGARRQSAEQQHDHWNSSSKHGSLPSKARRTPCR